jgi:hypothetical protein
MSELRSPLQKVYIAESLTRPPLPSEPEFLGARQFMLLVLMATCLLLCGISYLLEEPLLPYLLMSGFLVSSLHFLRSLKPHQRL